MCTQENDISRFSFYQAGKCVVEILLLNGQDLKSGKTKHGRPSRPNKNPSGLRQSDYTPDDLSTLGLQSLITKGQTLKSTYLPFRKTRTSFEIECTGLYAGKASELFTSISNVDTFVRPSSKVRFGACKNKVFTSNAEIYAGEALSLSAFKGSIDKQTKLYKRIRILEYKNKSAVQLPVCLDPFFVFRLCLAKLAFKKQSFLHKSVLQDKGVRCFALISPYEAKRVELYSYTAKLYKYKPCAHRNKFIRDVQSEALLLPKGAPFGSVNSKEQKRKNIRVRMEFFMPSEARRGSPFTLQSEALQRKVYRGNEVFACKVRRSFGTQTRTPLQVEGKKVYNKSAYSFLWQSDVDLSKRIEAIFLVQLIVVNGSIYSKNFFNLQKSILLGNLNKIEIKDKKAFDLFQNLEEQMTHVYLQQIQSNKQNKLLGSFGKLSKSSRELVVLSSYLKEGDRKNKVSSASLPRREVRSFCIPSDSQGDTLQSNTSGFSSRKALNSPSFLQATGFTSISLRGPTNKSNNFLESKKPDLISQKREISSLCEEIVCQSLTCFRKPYGHWFRIYLPQIETHQRQPISKDQFYNKHRELNLFQHIKGDSKLCTPSALQKLHTPQCVTLEVFSSRNAREIAKLLHRRNAQAKENCHLYFGCEKGIQPLAKRSIANPLALHSLRRALYRPQKLDYELYHTLIMSSFYRTFNLLGKNRELLDILADHLIRFGKIRTPEILRICSLYVYIMHTKVGDL